MGRRNRRRERLAGTSPGTEPAAPVAEYRDEEGDLLVLRGSLSAAARREYADVLSGGREREDAWQRATELLFERLAVSWTIAGLEIASQKELLARYRMASHHEREFVRDALRAHAGEHFPELRAP